LALVIISGVAGTGTAMQILEKAALTALEIAVNVLLRQLVLVEINHLISNKSNHQKIYHLNKVLEGG